MVALTQYDLFFFLSEYSTMNLQKIISESRKIGMLENKHTGWILPIRLQQLHCVYKLPYKNGHPTWKGTNERKFADSAF